MKGKRVRTIDESDSGRNLEFKDIKNGQEMTRAEFVKKIEDGSYEDYYVRMMHGLKTPISKPDNSEGNNLD